MNYNATLYSPTIEFANKEWLWNACLLWDKVYRIVPEGYIPNDRDEIRTLIEDKSVIANIAPEKYATEIFEDFKKVMDKSKWACALSEADYMDNNYVKLHEGKADVQLRELLIAGNKRDDEGFYHVPREFANIYMIYLSNYIAKKNNITLASDYDFSWLCSNFMESNGKLLDHDQGDNITKLGALTFANFIPRGIESLSAKELLAFREKSKDERHLFFDEMQKFSDTIMNVNDEKIITDIFNERIKDFQKCRDEYMKRMRDIKIEGFYGAKTVMFPLITTLATSLMNVSSEVARVLDVCGVCCGVIGGIWDTKRKLRAEAKKYSVNYLVELSYHISHYYYNREFRKHMEYSKLYYYHMYLNDRINEFLYD